MLSAMEKEVKQGRVRDTGGTGEETTNWGQEQEQGGETVHKEKQRSGVGEGPGSGEHSHGQRRDLLSSVHLASGSSALGHECHS